MDFLLDVKMLGGISITINGVEKELYQHKLTKPWQLFCYLVLRSGDVVTSRELIDVLWAEADINDALNVLKNTVYALRRELSKNGGADKSPIIYRNGGYTLSPDVKLTLDVDNFIALCSEAEMTAQNIHGYSDAAVNACRAALDAYKGDVLPMLASEPWAVLETRKCRRRYVNVAHILCRMLCEKGKCDEVLDVALRAVAIDPYDMVCIKYLFRAMEKKEMWGDIASNYSRISRYLKSELGTEPDAETKAIFERASAHVDKTEQELMLIKDDLTENAHRLRSRREAYYCNYDMLKHIYQFMQRSAERGGQMLMLMLVTLTNGDNEVTMEETARAMEDARIAISRSMRRSDAFSRYGNANYAVMLLVDSEASIETIERRLNTVFADMRPNRKFSLQYTCTKL